MDQGWSQRQGNQTAGLRQTPWLRRRAQQVKSLLALVRRSDMAEIQGKNQRHRRVHLQERACRAGVDRNECKICRCLDLAHRNGDMGLTL